MIFGWRFIIVLPNNVYNIKEHNKGQEWNHKESDEEKVIHVTIVIQLVYQHAAPVDIGNTMLTQCKYQLWLWTLTCLCPKINFFWLFSIILFNMLIRQLIWKKSTFCPHNYILSRKSPWTWQCNATITDYY